jgi:DNA-binding protein HU-beta
MSKSITKADLVSSIAAETGLKKIDAEKAVIAITNAITEALSAGNKVTIVNFGTFQVSQRAERMGRDPQTKQPIRIAASNTIRFRPGKAFRDSVN